MLSYIVIKPKVNYIMIYIVIRYLDKHCEIKEVLLGFIAFPSLL